MKVSKNTPKEFYENKLNELLEFIFYSYTEKDTIILFSILDILRKHKGLPWHKYY